MTIAATTTHALQREISDAIAASAPRITIRNVGRWVPFDRAPKAAAGSRHFSVQIASVGPTPGGLWCNGRYDATAEVAVITSYQVPEVDHALIEDDLHQLRETILSLRGNNSGVIHCATLGTQPEENSNADSVLVSHRLELRYMRSTEVN